MNSVATLYNFQCLIYRPRDHCSVADFDDRAIEQSGVGDDRRDDLVVRRVFGQAEFLELRLFFAEEVESRNAELL